MCWPRSSNSVRSVRPDLLRSIRRPGGPPVAFPPMTLLGRALRKLEGEGYIYRIDYKPGDKGWRDHGGVGFSVIEDRMATAYHEAGHAVIARTLGIPVKLATIKPGEGYAGRVLTKVSNYETQTRALWMREALMSFAGAIAEGEMGGIGSKDAWRTTRGEGAMYERPPCRAQVHR